MGRCNIRGGLSIFGLGYAVNVCLWRRGLAQQSLWQNSIIQRKFVNPHLRQPSGQRTNAAQGIGQHRAQTSFCEGRRGRHILLRQQGQTQQLGIVHAHKGNAHHPGQGLPVPAGAACGQAQPQAMGIVQLHAKGKPKGQRAGKVGDTRTDGRGSPRTCRTLHDRIDTLCQPRLCRFVAQGYKGSGKNRRTQQHTQAQHLGRTAQPIFTFFGCLAREIRRAESRTALIRRGTEGGIGSSRGWRRCRLALQIHQKDCPMLT